MNKYIAALAAIVLLSGHARAESGGAIVEASGVKGGLVVVLGCEDPELVAGLRVNDSYLVHGLDADATAIEKARKVIHGKGLYGKVSVDVWDGKALPYADNLVNLIVIQDAEAGVRDEEIQRVLAPRGTVMVGGKKTVKSVPADIDDWTHFMHGPDSNATAKDLVAGFPERMQWQAGPLRDRHHDTVQGIEAIVSARGRLIYIVDEAPPSVSDALPDQWRLVARDAFSGVVLWKKPMNKFGWDAWTGHSKIGRTKNPKQMHRRLVAVDDKVYVTLGFHAPVSAIDAATGKILRTYSGTESASEIIVYEGQLIVSVKNTESGSQSIMAVQPSTGEIAWKTGEYQGAKGIYAGVPDLFLSAGGGRVFFLDGSGVVGLDTATGKELWQTGGKSAAGQDQVEPAAGRKAKDIRGDKRAGAERRPKTGLRGYTALVYHDGMVFTLHPQGKSSATLTALSAESGQTRWTSLRGAYTYGTHSVLFVAQDLLWTHDLGVTHLVGLDPKSGEAKRRIDVTEAVAASGGHMRCYPGKSTEKTLWTSIGGKPQQVIDLDTGENCSMSWLRGGCRIGILPCNGLLYMTPHPCVCHIEVTLKGLLALGPAQEGPKPSSGEGLQKGPAFGKTPSTPPASGGDWPMYRYDGARSGATKAPVSAGLWTAWNVNVGPPSRGDSAAASALTQPVIADNRVFVASVDTHTVHALDADTGKTVWNFTTGGRIDSSPTHHKGTVLFGSADGWVYCLTAAYIYTCWTSRRARYWPKRSTIRPATSIPTTRLRACCPISSSVTGNLHTCGFPKSF